MTNKYNNINSKKNRNTDNNGNSDNNVSFLMTKTMIIVLMEGLVAIAIVTVIMFYRRNRME